MSVLKDLLKWRYNKTVMPLMWIDSFARRPDVLYTTINTESHVMKQSLFTQVKYVVKITLKPCGIVSCQNDAILSLLSIDFVYKFNCTDH